MSLSKRFAALAAAVAMIFIMDTASAEKKYDQGASDTEIKIGNTMPYSGPASAYGTIGKAISAYFDKLNKENGGINGRRINFISLDDGYSPPKTMEQFRKLVERERVLFMFESLGTAPNTAVRPYMNKKKIPQLFVATGATKWGDYENYPWTMGWQPSYRTEGQIFAAYVLDNYPTGKVGILYQNDDYGKDLLGGFKEQLGDKADKLIVAEESYEVSEPTISSQIIKLKASGANIFVDITTPKFAAQAIRKVYELNWKPVHLLNTVGSSVGAVLKPAGLEKAKGVITQLYFMDPTDPAYANEPGIIKWKEFMHEYFPKGDIKDGYNLYGYMVAKTMEQVLKQCGDNLTRANVMKQAANLRHFKLDTFFPGMEINTSPTDYRPIESMMPHMFNGKNYVATGKVVKAGNDRKMQ